LARPAAQRRRQQVDPEYPLPVDGDIDAAQTAGQRTGIGAHLLHHIQRQHHQLDIKLPAGLAIGLGQDMHIVADLVGGKRRLSVNFEADHGMQLRPGGGRQPQRPPQDLARWQQPVAWQQACRRGQHPLQPGFGQRPRQAGQRLDLSIGGRPQLQLPALALQQQPPRRCDQARTPACWQPGQQAITPPRQEFPQARQTQPRPIHR
jgi:hypothetical protein